MPVVTVALSVAIPNNFSTGKCLASMTSSKESLYLSPYLVTCIWVSIDREFSRLPYKGGKSRDGYRDQIVTCGVGVFLPSKVHPPFMKHSDGISTEYYAHTSVLVCCSFSAIPICPSLIQRISYLLLRKSSSYHRPDVTNEVLSLPATFVVTFIEFSRSFICLWRLC